MNRKLFFRVRDQRRLKFGQEFQGQMKMLLLNEFTHSRLCVFIKGGSVNLECVQTFLSTKIPSTPIMFMCMDVGITGKSQERPVRQEGISGSFHGVVSL